MKLLRRIVRTAPAPLDRQTGHVGIPVLLNRPANQHAQGYAQIGLLGHPAQDRIVLRRHRKTQSLGFTLSCHIQITPLSISTDVISILQNTPFVNPFRDKFGTFLSRLVPT